VASGDIFCGIWQRMIPVPVAQPAQRFGVPKCEFRQITLFCLEKHLSKHKMTILRLCSLLTAWLHSYKSIGYLWYTYSL